MFTENLTVKALKNSENFEKKKEEKYNKSKLLENLINFEVSLIIIFYICNIQIFSRSAIGRILEARCRFLFILFKISRHFSYYFVLFIQNMRPTESTTHNT